MGQPKLLGTIDLCVKCGVVAVPAGAAELPCYLCRTPQPDAVRVVPAEPVRTQREILVQRLQDTIPGPYRGLSFTGARGAVRARVKSAQAMAQVEALLRGDSLPAVVTLAGPTGCGKTTLACALLGEMIRLASLETSPLPYTQSVGQAHYTNGVRLRAARETYRYGSDMPNEIERALQASVLVFDEFGREGDRKITEHVVWTRMDAGRPLVIVTGFTSSADMMAAVPDGGLARRVFTDALVIDCGGPQ